MWIKCINQIAEDCVPTGLMWPSGEAWLICSRLSFVTSGVTGTRYSAACVSVCLPFSHLTVGENMEPLSASITHLIHHRCQADEFWCQQRPACRNVLCICVWGGSHQHRMLSLLFLFLLYNISSHKAHVSLLAYVHPMSLPIGQTSARRATQWWQRGGTLEKTEKKRGKEGRYGVWRTGKEDKRKTGDIL